MNLDADVCYRALTAHDARFDGLFYVGVSSTKIYCRTVCPARSPKRENCTFYESAAAAETAGYRPCLRCRPEMAPGKAHVDAVSTRARIAAKRIEEGALDDNGLKELAIELQISERQLRRAMREELGVSPVALAQTQRLLTAKQLLTDTNLPLGEVAFASGFSSLRRFNALFQDRYGMAPGALRREGRTARAGMLLRCELGYRPPLDWEGFLSYFGPRAIPGVEAALEGSFYRTVKVKGKSGWFRVFPHPDKARLVVELSPELGPVLPAVLVRIKRLFDLNAEPERIAAALGEIARENPGLRMPGAFDGLETAVRAIVGQQITVRFATVLMGRIAEAFGEPIETPVSSLARLFPTAERVAGLDQDALGQLGIIGTRSRAILELAKRMTSGELSFRAGVEPEETKRRLMEIKGIGPWTAEYIVMRVLGWPDAFLGGDLGIRKALGVSDSKSAEMLAEQWRPWRGYACAHLWKSLEKKS